MKKLTLFIFTALLSIAAKAQINDLAADKSTKLLTVNETVAIDTLDKKELFNNAKKWLSTSFSTGKDAITKEDALTGTITAKGNAVFTAQRKGEGNKPFDVAITFTIVVSCKEGEYTYTINHLIYGSAIYKKPAEEMLIEGKDEEANELIGQYRTNTLEKLNYIVESLKSAMLVRPAEAGE